MRARYFFLVALVLAWMAGCATQQPIGLVGNDIPKTVVAFAPSTDAIQGSANVPSRGDRDAYAFAIEPTGHQAYVSDRLGQIARVALDGPTPSVTGASITPSHTASDLTLVENNLSMLVAVGTDTASTAGVVSTINTANGTEIDRINLSNATPYSVAVCDDDQTVLISTDAPQAVRKLTVSPTGQLTSTGASFNTQRPVANVYCAPGSQTGVVVSSAGAIIQSFSVSTMAGIDTRDLAGQSGPARSLPLGLSGTFAPDGTRFFVRSERGDFTGKGFVEAFGFDPATGALGSNSQQTSIAPMASASRGTQEIAIRADGSQLYVTDPRNDRVLVLDPSSLSTIATLSDPDIDTPFGIVIGGSN